MFIRLLLCVCLVCRVRRGGQGDRGFPYVLRPASSVRASVVSRGCLRRIPPVCRGCTNASRGRRPVLAGKNKNSGRDFQIPSGGSLFQATNRPFNVMRKGSREPGSRRVGLSPSEKKGSKSRSNFESGIRNSGIRILYSERTSVSDAAFQFQFQSQSQFQSLSQPPAVLPQSSATSFPAAPAFATPGCRRSATGCSGSASKPPPN